MTIYELRLAVVLGLLALGALALLAAFVAATLKDLARRADARTVSSRALSSLRGDNHATGRLLDGRTAASRPRC